MSDLSKISGLPEEITEGLTKETQSVTVYLEKKRFGKLMTVISGLSSGGADIERVAKELKNKLACGGTVSEKKEILLQGDHRKKIKAVLGKLGFNTECIEVK